VQVLGGVHNDASTLTDCQEACVRDIFNCRGISWDDSNTECWFLSIGSITEVNDKDGFTYYVLNRMCKIGKLM